MTARNRRAILGQVIHGFETWYEATARRDPLSAVARGAVSCDVCVAGGGLAGLTLARELALAGKSVVLLEAKRIASGASGRNGGFVSAGFALGAKEIAAMVGLDAARALYKLSNEGAEYVRSRAGAAVMGNGMIVAQRHAGGFGGYAEKMNRDFGTTLETWPAAKTRSILNTRSYFGAIHIPGAFHIHPLRHALALAQSATAAGAQIFENRKALAITKTGNDKTAPS